MYISRSILILKWEDLLGAPRRWVRSRVRCQRTGRENGKVRPKVKIHANNISQQKQQSNKRGYFFKCKSRFWEALHCIGGVTLGAGHVAGNTI